MLGTERVHNDEVGYRTMDPREAVVENVSNFCVRCGWNITDEDYCGCDLMG